MLKDFTVIDFETTGLDSDNDKIIEIGAIRYFDRKIVGEFSALIKCDRPFSDGTKEKTGLVESDLIGAFEEEFGLRVLSRFIGNGLIVAHNALFELKFLENAFQRVLKKSVTNPFLDTLTVARDRKVYPHTLSDVCDYYDVWLDTKHRALNDCVYCAKLVLALDAEKSIDEWINVLGYMKKYGVPTGQPEHAKLIEQKIKYGAGDKKEISID